METPVYKVTSELYSEKDYITDSKPTLNKNNVVSRFPFTLPGNSPVIDEDGDLIVKRKPKPENYDHWIEIEHSFSTELKLVGLQIWRGALLLADWLIYNSSKLPKDKKILELGSGVGLTSIIASLYAPVICTDIDRDEILDLIRCNVRRNKLLVKNKVDVLGLDFTQPFSQEIKKELPNIEVILAADVIYDDTLTEAFVDTLERLFEDGMRRSVYIALEKRIVFTLEDLSTSAPCYGHFLQQLNKLKISGIKMEEISTDFQQYFQYDKVQQLVLWRVYN